MTKVKISLEKLLNSQQALVELANQKLPVTLSYKISIAYQNVVEKIKPVDDIRQKKIKEYGKEIKDQPGEYEIDREDKANFQKFQTEMEKLLEEEVEIEIPQIKTEDFPEDIMVEPKHITSLSWLIKDK